MPGATDTARKLDHTSFVPITTLAYRTGLSVSWLKAEARAGRIPFLRMGRRWMFNISAVEVAILERARASDEGGER